MYQIGSIVDSIMFHKKSYLPMGFEHNDYTEHDVPLLSQKFTSAVSARNAGLKFNNNFILDNRFHKFVIAAFVTFMTFVAFAGIYVLLSPKLFKLL